MAQLYLNFKYDDGIERKHWVVVTEYKLSDDGYIAWFKYRGPETGKEFLCILNRSDMSIQDWGAFLSRVGGGIAIGVPFGGPVGGVLGGAVGFVAFLLGLNSRVEGYYEATSKQLYWYGKIHKNDSIFRA